MRSRSIGRSVTLGFAGLATLLVAAYAALSYAATRRVSFEGLDAKLRATAEGFASACEWDEDEGRAEFELSDEFASQLAAASPGRAVEVWTWPGRVLLHRSGSALPALLEASAPHLGASSLRVADQTLRVCTLRLRVPERVEEGEGPQPGFDVLVRVAEDQRGLEATLAGIGLASVGFLVLAALCAFALGRQLSLRVVRPLRELGVAAAQSRPGRAAELPRRRNGDEIDQLALILQGALEAHAEALERQARFTANASHELRNPIAVLRSAAEVALLGERDPATYQELFGSVLKTSKRMADMVEALLSLARVQAGGATVGREEVDLEALVRAGAAEFAAARDGGGVELDLEPGLAVIGDPRMLAMLIGNLLANAVTHSLEGATVQVALSRGADGAPLLSVSNPALAGHEPVDERLFECFQRGRSDAAAPQGAGIGLSIVAGIAELHGARVTLLEEDSRVTCVVRFAATEPGSLSRTRSDEPGGFVASGG